MDSAILLLLMALGSGVEPPETGDAASGEYVSGLAVGRAWEQDSGGGPDLAGFRIGFTAFSRPRSSGHGHTGTWYVEWTESSSQQILEGGMEVAYPYFQFSKVGFGPRFRLAIQDRAEPPDPGVDVLFGVGFELGVWVSERVQVAALADRVVGLETGTRNSYSVNLRVMLWSD